MLAKINVKMKGEDGEEFKNRPILTVNFPTKAIRNESGNLREDSLSERNSLIDEDSFDDNASIGIMSDDSDDEIVSENSDSEATLTDIDM